MGDYSKTTQKAKYYFISQYRDETSTKPATYPPSHSETLTPFWLKWSDGLEGRTNPGWRHTVALGQSAGSPMTASRKTVRATPGRAFVRYKYKAVLNSAINTVEKEVTGYFLSSAYTFPSAATIGNNVAYNKALSDFFPAAKDAMRQMSLGVSIGEYGETIRMLRGGVKGISKGLRDYFDRITKYNRSLNKRHARGTPFAKRVSAWNANAREQYLQTTYGIAPFIRDVRSAGESASRIWNELEQKQYRVTSIGTETLPSGNGQNNTSYFGTIQMAWRWQDFDICMCKIHGAVKTYSTQGMRNLAVLGFLPEDFIPTMYDLIPGSFLLDYSTNIGDIVEAYSFPRHRFAWLMLTYVTTRRRQFTDITCNPEREYWVLQPWQRLEVRSSWQAPTLELETTTVSRQHFSADDLGNPELITVVPGLKNWRKYVNMTALVSAQKLARRSNPLTRPPKGLMFGVRP